MGKDFEIKRLHPREIKGYNSKHYMFFNLFLPKVITIDKPGVIYNFVNKKFGGVSAKRRALFYFEDIFVDIQKETIYFLGKKKATEIWYKIGKDSGTRYTLFGKSKRIPNFLLPNIVNYILTSLLNGGLGAARNYYYDGKNYLKLKH